MTNIKGEFEEYGVPEDVLADLQAVSRSQSYYLFRSMWMVDPLIEC